MSIQLTIHSTGDGMCSLTGKSTDGLTVTFSDGTVNESFLSWKSFRMLLGLKAGQNGKKPLDANGRPPAVVPGASDGKPAMAAAAK